MWQWVEAGQCQLSIDQRSQHRCARCVGPREIREGLGLQKAREGWPHKGGRDTLKTLKNPDKSAQCGNSFSV